MSRWVGIKDFKVVKVGTKCRTCLDYDDPMDDSENEDEGSDLQWFEATVLRTEVRRNANNSRLEGCNVVVHRDHDSRDSEWNVFLMPSTYEFFEILVNDWDE